VPDEDRWPKDESQDCKLPADWFKSDVITNVPAAVVRQPFDGDRTGLTLPNRCSTAAIIRAHAARRSPGIAPECQSAPSPYGYSPEAIEAQCRWKLSRYAELLSTTNTSLGPAHSPRPSTSVAGNSRSRVPVVRFRRLARSIRMSDAVNAAKVLDDTDQVMISTFRMVRQAPAP
jgi:hypothetical protein